MPGVRTHQHLEVEWEIRKQTKSDRTSLWVDRGEESPAFWKLLKTIFPEKKKQAKSDDSHIHPRGWEGLGR